MKDNIIGSITTAVRIRYYYSKHGLVKTLWRTIGEIWRALFRPGFAVYMCELSERIEMKVAEAPGLSFEEITSGADMPPEFLAQHADFHPPELMKPEVEERFRQGATCCIVRQHGQVAAWGWIMIGRTREPYFFKLAADEAHLFDFFVFPQFRGRKINPTLVQRILQYAVRGGCRRAYIETAVWNKSEQISLRRTQFERLGEAHRFILAGRHFTAWRGGLSRRLKRRPAAACSMGAAVECAPPDDWKVGPTDVPKITFTVFDSFEQIAHLRETWDALAAELGFDIYQTFDWCRILWKHYGDKRRLMIFVFESDGRLIGVAPMFTELLVLPPTWLRIAKLIGSDHGLQTCGLLVRTEHADVVNRLLVDYLINCHECDVVSFSPLSPLNETTQKLLTSGRELDGREVKLLAQEIDVQSVFLLPPTFSEYLQHLSKSQRANFKRDTNLLAKSFAFSWDIVSDPREVPGAFAEFITVHQRQWQAEGKGGHFGDWPGAVDFNSELVEVFAAQGRVRLYRLLANGIPISSQYGYVFNHRLCWRLSARAIGEQWQRFGIGRMGLMKMIELAIAEGVQLIEAGRGHYGYKTMLGCQEVRMVGLKYCAGRLSSRLRLMCFRLLRWLLNAAYYKVFFRRLMPQFPFLQGHLWRVWIRTQI